MLRALAAIILSTLFFIAPARAAEPDFYAGKTIHIVIGAAAGAAYDFMGRVLASHIGKYIPGNPAVVVENAPGAASLVMLNSFANRAPRDGTYIGLPLGGIIHEPRLQALSREGAYAQFDARTLGWIGSPAQQPLIYVTWGRAGFDKFEDLRAREATFATTAQGGDNYVLPVMTNQLLGTRIKLVSGYKGVNDIFVAMEQGEVQGTAMVAASLLAKDDWLRERKARVPLHFGAKPVLALPFTPSILDVAPDDETRRLFRLYGLKYRTTYPFITPPGVPAERLATLRASFDATMKDKAFIADAAKFGIDIDPVSGAEMESIIAELDAAPREAIDRLKGFLAEK